MNTRVENTVLVLDALQALYPTPCCELDHVDPFQLLVATVLSAQCTDKVVNQVTPVLFQRWPDAWSLVTASPEALEEVIHSTGFFRSKARHLLGLARVLVDEHGGAVPTEMSSLVALPGVARKTANVVLGTAFGIRSGIVVDTHVQRVTMRWGWHTASDAVKIERVLMEIVPEERWIDFGHQGVLFGRYLCRSRNPSCGACTMRVFCPSRS